MKKPDIYQIAHLLGGLFVLIALAGMLFLKDAQAQATGCKSDEACVSWHRPTQTINRLTGEVAPLPASTPLTYNIWRAPQGSTTFEMVGQTQQLSAKLLAQPRGIQCYAVTAVMALTAESDLSESRCKTIRPRAPSDGKIERPTDGAIEGAQSNGKN